MSSKGCIVLGRFLVERALCLWIICGSVQNALQRIDMVHGRAEEAGGGGGIGAKCFTKQYCGCDMVGVIHS